MRITCPACKLSKDIPESSIPPTTKFVTCPRCGTKFDFNRDASPLAAASIEGPLEPESLIQQGAEIEEQPWRTARTGSNYTGMEDKGVPWESESSSGMLLAFFKTINGALFTPRKMFSFMAPNGRLSYPITFAIIVGTIVVLFGVLYNFIFISELFFSQFPELGTYQNSLVAIGGPTLLILAAIFAPLWIIIMVSFWTVALHLSLIILRGATFAFRTTFKVVSYSSAAHLWNIIPIIGQAISGIWVFVILIIGLSEAHQISKLKAFLAIILFPLLMTMIAVVVSFTLPFILQ